jgi:hypothetical protein
MTKTPLEMAREALGQHIERNRERLNRLYRLRDEGRLTSAHTEEALAALSDTSRAAKSALDALSSEGVGEPVLAVLADVQRFLAAQSRALGGAAAGDGEAAREVFTLLGRVCDCRKALRAPSPAGGVEGWREKLEELRALSEAATPGAFSADLHHTADYAGRTHGFVRAAGELAPLAAVILSVEGYDNGQGRANARLLAEAVNFVRALLSTDRPAEGSAPAEGAA